jgi:hypothetical protein
MLMRFVLIRVKSMVNSRMLMRMLMRVPINDKLANADALRADAKAMNDKLANADANADASANQ